MKEQWATDKWHVSYLNFLPDVREGFTFPKEVIISDCTLREGEQQAGVVLWPSDKLREFVVQPWSKKILLCERRRAERLNSSVGETG